ncbi:MAG: PaaI family thioesterase [Desulfobacterales bacterium]
MQPDRLAHLKQDFSQGFIAFCGYEAVHAAEGIFHSRLALRADHRQQDGFVHAGVLATMADHTAGYAAFTTVEADQRILTIEFKINFLKPAVGQALACRAQVLQRGRTLIVSEAEVFAVRDDQEKRVAKATFTMIPVAAARLQPQ